MDKQPLKSQSSDSARSLEDAIAEYLDDAGARARGRTMELYASVLNRNLLPWAQGQGLARADELTQRVISRWVGWLRNEYRTARGEPLSEFSIRTYVRTVNSFLKFLATDSRAQAPTPKRRVLEVLSRAEMVRLEAAARTERDKLLIRVLADTGARLGEALALREADIQQRDRREHVLRLRGKTGERLAPIGSDLYRRLRRYVEHGRPADYDGDRVFVGLHRVRGGGYQTPGRGTVEAMFREAARGAGIRRRVHPHLLRHSALTHLLRRNVNPLLVAQIAGHSSLEMIRSTYSHLTISDAHAAVMRALVMDEDRDDT